jgi:hypothetical protein
VQHGQTGGGGGGLRIRLAVVPPSSGPELPQDSQRFCRQEQFYFQRYAVFKYLSKATIDVTFHTRQPTYKSKSKINFKNKNLTFVN